MPKLHVIVDTPVSQTVRARQLCGMFDVPATERSRLEWKADVPIEERPWNVGLIFGPSGSGKTSVARQLFGDALDKPLTWGGASVIDDFPAERSIIEVAEVCQAVGFNTIPAWQRPFAVLSNGEKFRVEMARRLIEGGDLIACDEFTSVVDRQVARIGAHAVQKYVRRASRKFVAVSCHSDIIDWLQPDWTFEPAECRFEWRSLRRRPAVECVVAPVSYSAWHLFAPFHYLSRDLNCAARCFGLWADGRLAAFAGVLHRPHANRSGLWGISRVVTLPDFQGIGLAFVLMDALGSIYRGVGRDLRMYPAHPPFVRAMDRSPKWSLVKRPGIFEKPNHITGGSTGREGGRPCAVFEYIGEAAPREQAEAILATFRAGAIRGSATARLDGHSPTYVSIHAVQPSCRSM